MRILYWIPRLHTNGADHWIFLGWKHGFEDAGHDFFELTAADVNWREAIDRARPDILFCQNLVDLERHAPDLLWAREYGIRVFLVVHWPMPAADVAIMREHDVADVYFGEREPESMMAFVQATGRTYTLIPNAADSRLHHPVAPVAKYACDIAFVGSRMRTKRWFNVLLAELRRTYNVRVYGPGWTWQDRVARIASSGIRDAAPGMADWINRRRVVLPAKDEAALYSSARICLNFHEQVPGHVIVNQRTFKLAACGGFQIADDVPAIRRYFGDDIVMAGLDPDDWLDKINYYMFHGSERRDLQAFATRRAQAEHLSTHRVAQVMELAGIKKAQYPPLQGAYR